MTRLSLRRHLEDWIERAIEILDEVDGDADLEMCFHDDEDDDTREPANFGRAIETLNPPALLPRQIRRRRAA
jgi:hypothetical protein